MRTDCAELPARAPLLILHTQSAPRRVCVAEGSAVLGHTDRVAKILDVLRNYVVPEAVDAILQRVMGVRPAISEGRVKDGNGDWLPGAICLDIAYGQRGPFSSWTVIGYGEQP